MARIRTIKPEFFRHELLQQLEIEHPGKQCMLVFAALWGHCERTGTFEWKPRQLKLDILPFLPFDMAETMAILEASGLLIRREISGKQWGNIPTFPVHQRITGKEATQKLKFPQAIEFSTGITRELFEHQQGSEGETPETLPGAQEGKEEGKGTRKGEGSGGNTLSGIGPRPVGLDPDAWQLWVDWCKRRGHPIEPDQVEAAQRHLASFHGEQRAVVDQAIAGGWKNLLPLKRVGNGHDAEAERAWDELTRTEQPPTDARVRKAIDAIGGWQRFRLRRSSEVTVLRRQFVRAFQEAA